jgi:pimeloyl-ACP methyl ester carboxylesterase
VAGAQAPLWPCGSVPARVLASTWPSLKDLRVPTLVVQPGFDDSAFYVEPGWNYMRNLCLDSWRGAADASDRLEFVTVPRSRLFIMYDQPEELDRTVDRFLRRRKE